MRTMISVFSLLISDILGSINCKDINDTSAVITSISSSIIDVNEDYTYNYYLNFDDLDLKCFFNFICGYDILNNKDIKHMVIENKNRDLKYVLNNIDNILELILN